MSQKKSKTTRTQDRQLMDAAGAPKHILAETAAADREAAQVKHADKGLRGAKREGQLVLAATLHGLKSDSVLVKRACLEEIADNCARLSNECRTAVRKSVTEKMNVQPSTPATT